MTNHAQLRTTGIPEMDAQHRQLNEIAKQLRAVLIEGSVKELTLKICNNFAYIVRQHFDSEERLMLKYFYPGTESHIGQHMKLQTILSDLVRHVTNEEVKASIATLDYLITWHTDHVNQADKKYADYILENSP